MLLMEILTITRDRECVSLNCHRHKYAEILPAAFHTFDLSARDQTTITCDLAPVSIQILRPLLLSQRFERWLLMLVTYGVSYGKVVRASDEVRLVIN